MNADAMGRYLHFSTELLAIVSKIGQLYIQDFSDPQALAAVDQFENLTTGLSSKIWQKLTVLDRVRATVERHRRGRRSERWRHDSPAGMPVVRGFGSNGWPRRRIGDCPRHRCWKGR